MTFDFKAVFRDGSRWEDRLSCLAVLHTHAITQSRSDDLVCLMKVKISDECVTTSKHETCQHTVPMYLRIQMSETQ